MNHAVARKGIGADNGGVVDHHASVNGEGELQVVERRGGHAVRNVRSGNDAGDHVILQDAGEFLFPCGRIKIAEVNVCVGEGLVGWSEHREGTRTLEGFQEPCLNHSIDQCVVVSVALSGPWNVVGCVGG